MSNDERVEKLKKRIDISLDYSETIENKEPTSKPDKTKLKKLAQDIRKNLEEYPSEASAYPNVSYRP